MQTTTTRDSEVVGAARAGVTAIAPLVIGFAPFALVVGATIGAASNHEAGIAGSWLIYGGSAQIATVRALETGGALTAILAALLINTRLLVYSASLSQHWRDQPLWFRVMAAPMIVDPVWAVAEARALEPGSPREIHRALLRCRDHPVPGVERAHRRGRLARQPARQSHARRRGAAVPGVPRQPSPQRPAHPHRRDRSRCRRARGSSASFRSGDLRRRLRRLAVGSFLDRRPS